MAEKEAKSDYGVVQEGQEEVLRINSIRETSVPSIEGNANVMAKTINMLISAPGVSRIRFYQRKNYEYDQEQTQMLIEVAQLYNYLVRQKKVLRLDALGDYGNRVLPSAYTDVNYVILNLLRTDPLGAYVETKRLLREEKIKLKYETNKEIIDVRNNYVSILTYLLMLIKQLKIINLAEDKLDGYVIGDRSLYREIFRPLIMPNFMFTKLMTRLPRNGIEVDAYLAGDNEINIYKLPDKVGYFYHIMSPEFRIDEDKYELLELSRNVLAEHKPREEEFTDPYRMRRTFFNIGRDLLSDLASQRGIELSFEEVNELARMLVRYTVGFGLIEVLLEDNKIQDITINGPIGQTNIFIVHEDYGECVTNIIPSEEDGESWATRFRLLSGRPLDEANPVLDTELILPWARARVAVMTKPLNPLGLAYAFRRHRDMPWTLPLFMKNRTMSSVCAGLISFLVDGGRTILFSGTRGSGKTSLMTAMMLEILRKYRIITIEDTNEIPIDVFRKIGYNIQPMKVRSALTHGGSELAADEGIRTSLRLGDSSLIVGEVRSVEAAALYEAMRIGALANVVAGTIHGADPYSVFDRVVNDLKVPRTSFKATDIILTSNLVSSADGLHKYRRIVQLTEVRKHWEEDPLAEQGFIDLLKYDVKDDDLRITDNLLNGDSEIIKSVAGNVKEFAGNWDAVWDNILLRAKIKEKLLEYSLKTENNELLEAEFIVKSNDVFHNIIDKVKEETGLDNKRILKDFEDWLKKEIKK